MKELKLEYLESGPGTLPFSTVAEAESDTCDIFALKEEDRRGPGSRQQSKKLQGLRGAGGALVVCVLDLRSHQSK